MRCLKDDLWVYEVKKFSNEDDCGMLSLFMWDNTITLSKREALALVKCILDYYGEDE